MGVMAGPRRTVPDGRRTVAFGRQAVLRSRSIAPNLVVSAGGAFPRRYGWIPARASLDLLQLRPHLIYKADVRPASMAHIPRSVRYEHR